jgi:N-acetylglutamate synthase-like GNAT family acetyltransferase
MTRFHVIGASLPSGLDGLARLAASEGFGMIDRLISDYRAGSNTFSKSGEGLWAAEADGQLVAVGGINVDPYYDAPSLGRIRHLYVHPEFRRVGVGRDLMKCIEDHGNQHFECFQLFTTTLVASVFYESLGYSRVANQWKVSHVKRVAP